VETLPDPSLGSYLITDSSHVKKTNTAASQKRANPKVCSLVLRKSQNRGKEGQRCERKNGKPKLGKPLLRCLLEGAGILKERLASPIEITKGSHFLNRLLRLERATLVADRAGAGGMKSTS